MSTTFKPSYSSNSAITITLASLINSTSLSTGYRQSAAVDNTTNLYADAHIYGHVKSNATPTANAAYFLFLYWSNDGGTTYSNNASGSDAAYTSPDADANIVQGATSITTAVASLVSYFKPFSFCQAAGLLFLPSKWGVILKNASGQTLTATGTDHVISYQGVNWQGI
jgi:hypothetical protein